MGLTRPFRQPRQYLTPTAILITDIKITSPYKNDLTGCSYWIEMAFFTKFVVLQNFDICGLTSKK